MSIRITNAMMTNTTLMHINRNVNNLDTLIRQIESTKKISLPSDNPIIASRALKFRTSVLETEQFQRNVQNGIAWMNVAEASYRNVVESLMKQINERCVQGAHGTYTGEDKMALIADLRELLDQIGVEMNQTYAGRYVFSGLRTDEPPSFVEDNDRRFIITQTFEMRDIEKTKSYQKLLPYAEATVHEINILKLPYKNIEAISIPGYTVSMKSIDDVDAYLPGAGEIFYVRETGELVMDNASAVSFPSGGINVTYEKEGFKKGEPNPAVYFQSREIADGAGTLTAPGITSYTYQITQLLTEAAGTTVAGVPPTVTYALAYPPASLSNLTQADPSGLRPTVPPPLKLYNTAEGAPPPLTQTGVVHLDPATGVLSMSEETSRLLANTPLTYSIDVPAGAVSPMLNMDVQGAQLVKTVPPTIPMDHTLDPNRYYTMDDQELRMEFATNTYVTINSYAKDALTANFYADMKRLIDFAESLKISEEGDLVKWFSGETPGSPYAPPNNLVDEDLKNAVTTQLTTETANLQAALYDRFNNMLYLIDRHSAQAMKEHIQIGTRMYRLDLMQVRLEQDEASYTKLKSDNEDTDLEKAIMFKFVAEAAYQASLRANSNMVQLSLANFIG